MSMLWSGRFASGPHDEMLRLTASIEVDVRLLPFDLAATKAHARTLEAAGLLDGEQVAQIHAACDEILEDWEAGRLAPHPGDEDVHSLVERELTERIGETGSRIHAGRSRNDLVATDMRLWARAAAEEQAAAIGSLLEVVAGLAEEHADTIMSGYTHLQRAQPVTLGFHLLAHGFALARDGERFLRARAAADVSALGAGALAGTTLPLDPGVAAAELGFGEVFANAMDATADRDFLWELAFACAASAVHLSRLAEEIVLWTSSEFGFARLSDEWSTGSSMMPQKRNPDLAELIRGRAARPVADLIGLLTIVKGLPLAYGRDLQEDKRFIFGATDVTLDSVTGMTHLLRALEFDRGALAAAASGAGAVWATDVAEILVSRGVPFRVAHEAAGGLVADLEGRGLTLGEAPLELLRSHHPALQETDRAVADPAAGVARRSSPGGTAPARVAEQVARLREVGHALDPSAVRAD